MQKIHLKTFNMHSYKKKLRKEEIEEHFLNVVKAICKIHTGSMIFNVKMLEAIHLNSGKGTAPLY